MDFLYGQGLTPTQTLITKDIYTMEDTTTVYKCLCIDMDLTRFKGLALYGIMYLLDNPDTDQSDDFKDAVEIALLNGEQVDILAIDNGTNSGDPEGLSGVIMRGREIHSVILDDMPHSCNHKWKRYVGFTDIYDYCETCGDKKK
jgi:hypothetical protein